MLQPPGPQFGRVNTPARSLNRRSSGGHRARYRMAGSAVWNIGFWAQSPTGDPREGPGPISVRPTYRGATSFRGGGHASTRDLAVRAAQ
jgi:hypothetical protein